jgi:hypothetical protein
VSHKLRLHRVGESCLRAQQIQLQPQVGRVSGDVLELDVRLVDRDPQALHQRHHVLLGLVGLAQAIVQAPRCRPVLYHGARRPLRVRK